MRKLPPVLAASVHLFTTLLQMSKSIGPAQSSPARSPNISPPAPEVGGARNSNVRLQLRMRRAPPPARPDNARDHAWHFVQWCKYERGAHGQWVSAAELKGAYAHYCACNGLSPRGWSGPAGIGQQLGILLAKKENRERVGSRTRKVVVYRIPRRGGVPHIISGVPRVVRAPTPP
jgi:hypothetical protein